MCNPSIFEFVAEYVGKTFAQKFDANQPQDMYTIGKEEKDLIGIDENDNEFAKGRWCFDTPGVMHPDQVCTLFLFLCPIYLIGCNFLIWSTDFKYSYNWGTGQSDP